MRPDNLDGVKNKNIYSFYLITVLPNGNVNILHQQMTKSITTAVLLLLTKFSLHCDAFQCHAITHFTLTAPFKENERVQF